MATFDTLAKHVVIATFDGIVHQPCRFMTSLCPDRCGHAKDLAVFKIDEYVDFEKNSQYGEKVTVFQADINPNAVNNRQEQKFIDIMKTLQPGQKVKIHWDHIYVHNNGANYPERLIRELEVL